MLGDAPFAPVPSMNTLGGAPFTPFAPLSMPSASAAASNSNTMLGDAPFAPVPSMNTLGGAPFAPFAPLSMPSASAQQQIGAPPMGLADASVFQGTVSGPPIIPSAAFRTTTPDLGSSLSFDFGDQSLIMPDAQYFNMPPPGSDIPFTFGELGEVLGDHWSHSQPLSPSATVLPLPSPQAATPSIAPANPSVDERIAPRAHALSNTHRITVSSYASPPPFGHGIPNNAGNEPVTNGPAAFLMQTSSTATCTPPRLNRLCNFNSPTPASSNTPPRLRHIETIQERTGSQPSNDTSSSVANEAPVPSVNKTLSKANATTNTPVSAINGVIPLPQLEQVDSGRPKRVRMASKRHDQANSIGTNVPSCAGDRVPRASGSTQGAPAPGKRSGAPAKKDTQTKRAKIT
ncbi:hypothetical protein BJ138DRAFT_1120503 [Hygrophoropsis aurantiaca]|uniref:Uncharacterized protein n=1 Tax=Hygrophoropsis aurantiaca TaxID=72124 RepID=A0ACB7ZR89_9AGAM|nr:hypothetical protein BJ138DRAFT_1120503 [Hygrophoropsis aurantiaca]